MKNLDLIIGIPSFSRSKELSKLITELKEIINDNTEVVVVENFSANMLKNKFIENKIIKYFAKSTNQGLDKSIIQLICYAKRKNKKIWFLCDDDFLEHKNIKDIIKRIKNSTSNVDYIDWKGTDGKSLIKSKKEAYLRMSFLPCVAINPKELKLNSLYKLNSNGYIHIAIINSLLNDINDINLINICAGKQNKNIKTRFSITDTFINGYQESLKYRQILSDRFLNSHVFERVYSSLTYLKDDNYSFDIFKKYINFCINQKGITLYKKLKLFTKAILIKWI